MDGALQTQLNKNKIKKSKKHGTRKKQKETVKV